MPGEETWKRVHSYRDLQSEKDLRPTSLRPFRRTFLPKDPQPGLKGGFSRRNAATQDSGIRDKFLAYNMTSQVAGRPESEVTDRRVFHPRSLTNTFSCVSYQCQGQLLAAQHPHACTQNLVIAPFISKPRVDNRRTTQVVQPRFIRWKFWSERSGTEGGKKASDIR